MHKNGHFAPNFIIFSEEIVLYFKANVILPVFHCMTTLYFLSNRQWIVVASCGKLPHNVYHPTSQLFRGSFSRFPLFYFLQFKLGIYEKKMHFFFVVVFKQCDKDPEWALQLIERREKQNRNSEEGGAAPASIINELTHCSRDTRKRVLGKQCRPRSV